MNCSLPILWKMWQYERWLNHVRDTYCRFYASLTLDFHFKRFFDLLNWWSLFVSFIQWINKLIAFQSILVWIWCQSLSYSNIKHKQMEFNYNLEYVVCVCVCVYFQYSYHFHGVRLNANWHQNATWMSVIKCMNSNLYMLSCLHVHHHIC